MPPPHAPALNEELASLVTQNVLAMLGSGLTWGRALDLARQAQTWAEGLMARFEADNPLPYPIACRPGCDFCCYNQIEVIPLEVLAIGSHLQALPAEEQAVLKERLSASAASRAGKSKHDIAGSRRDFPCPFLSQGLCSIYPVRPLVCRAMHSLDADLCRQSLGEENLTPDRYYLHREEIVLSIIHGLGDGCRAVGCPAAPLDLSQAVQKYLQDPERVRQEWLPG